MDARYDASANVPDARVDAQTGTPDAGVDASTTTPDANVDASTADASVDAVPTTADAAPDAVPPDAVPPDAVPPDAVPPDAEPPDAGPPDALELGQVEVMFSVDVGGGTQGLTGTGVNDESPNAPSSIYGSDGVGPTHVAGTNETYVLNAMLGLAATDDVDAHSILKASPTNPVFYFSVKDVAAQDEGQASTPVRRSSDEAEDPGDIFSSQGITTLGPAANMLVTDEVRLGQQPETEGGTPKDNLNALDLDVDNPQVVYFSVTKASVGLSGSAVDQTDPGLRGCTIYRSWLDGSNELVFTCAEIGLLAGDEVDALVAIGTEDPPDEIYFSVDAASVGASGTAVETQQIAGEQEGDIFWSAGNDTNGLLVDEQQLGLQPTTSGDPVDELDALTIRDEELPPKFEFSVDCPLVPNPYEIAGPVYWAPYAAAYVGAGLFAVIGYEDDSGAYTEQIQLYDSVPVADECLHVVTISMGLPEYAIPYWVTVGVGAGWDRATPQTGLSIWALFDYGGNLYFAEMDGQGTLISEYPVTPPWVDFPYHGLMIYKPAVDHFAVPVDLERDGPPHDVLFWQRPTAAMTPLDFWTYPIPVPCTRLPLGIGYDPVSGGIDILDPYYDDDHRICQLTNDMFFRELPRVWLPGTPTLEPYYRYGVLISPLDRMLDVFATDLYEMYVRLYLPHVP